ncbi:MAG TPA: acyltransferase [Mycobacterium sp.]|nr:acyltransferase [Mycobacterium sp.]
MTDTLAVLETEIKLYRFRNRCDVLDRALEDQSPNIGHRPHGIGLSSGGSGLADGPSDHQTDRRHRREQLLANGRNLLSALKVVTTVAHRDPAPGRFGCPAHPLRRSIKIELPSDSDTCSCDSSLVRENGEELAHLNDRSGARAVITVLERYRESSRRHLRRAERANYRLDIKDLRAVAVLAVFAYHLWDLPGAGFIGIDVFLVLTGFFATHTLLTSAADEGTVFLRRFYVDRARRIIPAASLVLIPIPCPRCCTTGRCTAPSQR